MPIDPNLLNQAQGAQNAAYMQHVARIQEQQRAAALAQRQARAQAIQQNRQSLNQYRALTQGSREEQFGAGLGRQDLRAQGQAEMQFLRSIDAAQRANWRDRLANAAAAHQAAGSQLAVGFLGAATQANLMDLEAKLGAAGGGGGGGGFGGGGDGSDDDVLTAGDASLAGEIAMLRGQRGEQGEIMEALAGPRLRKFLFDRSNPQRAEYLRKGLSGPINPAFNRSRILEGGWTTRLGAEEDEAIKRWKEAGGRKGTGVKKRAIRRFFKKARSKGVDWRTRNRRSRLQGAMVKAAGRGF